MQQCSSAAVLQQAAAFFVFLAAEVTAVAAAAALQLHVFERISASRLIEVREHSLYVSACWVDVYIVCVVATICIATQRQI